MESRIRVNSWEQTSDVDKGRGRKMMSGPHSKPTLGDERHASQPTLEEGTP